IRLRPDELPLVRGLGFPAADPPALGVRGRFASWYEYRFLILDRYAPTLVMGNQLNAGHEPDRHGFTRLREVPPDETAALVKLTHSQYADYLGEFRPNGPGVAAVRDMLDSCRAVKLPAALVLMPESR